MSGARWTQAEAAALIAKREVKQDANRERLMKKAVECSKPALEKQPSILIGVDPGTNTGIAIKENGVFVRVQTVTIIEAIGLVTGIGMVYPRGNILVRIEDARLRTYFGKSGSEKWKGAGSIMRDCSIWEDEMKRQGIRYQMVHPKNVKATTAEQFKALTGWKYRTSIHAREAAWMII